MAAARPSIPESDMNRAVILAGGRGTRLRPYTVSLPKPLMPIVDHPILEIIIRQLARAGFEHVTLTVNYQAEIFRAYFGDGSKWRIRIDYSLETQPLGTMGPLRLIPDLPNDFLVMNGDVLTDLDFRAFLSEHTQGRRLFSISAAAREQRIDYRVLHVGRDGLLSAFQEKPITAYLVSMGIYALNRRVLDSVTILRPFNVYGPGQSDRFLLPRIAAQVVDRNCQEIVVRDLAPRRDYIFVSDAIDAILVSLATTPGSLFNIGREHPIRSRMPSGRYVA
jgi:NDP-mannose synthase